ncbi:hypothetical protein Maes01_00524 [Microbulbifer aestuariivivens]|uniref:Uncharacterized protein n=1 Tax=Microbulbifer aestuariivivens TaxID=1908308 RepID=A0ABP9WP49_9GAMM
MTEGFTANSIHRQRPKPNDPKANDRNPND